MAKGGIFWLVIGLLCAVAIGIIVGLGTAGVLPVGDVIQIVVGLGSLVTGVMQVLERYSADPNAFVATAGMAASVAVIVSYGTNDGGSHPDEVQGRCPGCGGGR